jgi:hypothetical protein
MSKTRLSREFKELITPKNNEDEELEDSQPKVIYYNAFTEDLFYWDNDLDSDTERKLKIQPNTYTHWVLQEQGQDQNAIANFQRYTSDKLSPKFSEDFSEVTFSFERGNEERSENIKISKGEESNFIWSIFYSLIGQVLEQAIAENQIQKFHFTLLRNLYEKTASFLGYGNWTDLLKTAPGDKDSYLKRIITFSSHRTLSNEEVTEPTDPEKQTVKLLLDNLTNNYGFYKQEKQND